MDQSLFSEDQAKAAAEALTAFKDWSNYLLVTTVAALGWVGSRETPLDVGAKISAGCLCASIICGIFTLALVPLLREKIITINALTGDLLVKREGHSQEHDGAWGGGRAEVPD